MSEQTCSWPIKFKYYLIFNFRKKQTCLWGIFRVFLCRVSFLILGVLCYYVTNPSRAHLFSTIACTQGGKCIPSLNTLSSRYATNLKFVPELLLVRWWQLMTLLVKSCDQYAMLKPETKFCWLYLKWKMAISRSQYVCNLKN